MFRATKFRFLRTRKYQVGHTDLRQPRKCQQSENLGMEQIRLFFNYFSKNVISRWSESTTEAAVSQEHRLPTFGRRQQRR